MSGTQREQHDHPICSASPADDLDTTNSGIPSNKTSQRSGVYEIRCMVTNKIYIGSSVDMKFRWAQHRVRLNKGHHRNAHLQAAWNRYGESAFQFTVLQYAERADLLRIEQEWIERTNCADRDVGFNIYKVAGSPGDSSAREWKGFISPDGAEMTIVNLHDFCHQNNLDFPSMLKLAHGTGKLKSYKGWTHKNSPRIRPYCKTYVGFVAPDGTCVDPIFNLAAFCRRHNLENSHMVALYHGRILSHCGWTHVNARSRVPSFRKYDGFVDPTGSHVTITNLKEFCNEHGLSYTHMHQIKTGQRRSHKGWTWSEPK